MSFIINMIGAALGIMGFFYVIAFAGASTDDDLSGILVAAVLLGVYVLIFGKGMSKVTEYTNANVDLRLLDDDINTKIFGDAYTQYSQEAEGVAKIRQIIDPSQELDRSEFDDIEDYDPSNGGVGDYEDEGGYPEQYDYYD